MSREGIFHVIFRKKEHYTPQKNCFFLIDGSVSNERYGLQIFSSGKAKLSLNAVHCYNVWQHTSTKPHGDPPIFPSESWGRARHATELSWWQVSLATDGHISSHLISSSHSPLQLVPSPGEFKEPIFTSWRTIVLSMALETGCYVSTQHEIKSFEFTTFWKGILAVSHTVGRTSFPSVATFHFSM